MSQKSTERFSDRVEDYVRYRPHYPQAVIDVLRTSYGVHDKELVADIGAGTGISSELFLKAGFSVIGVEPNAEMRHKAAVLLRPYKNFTIQDGTAEATGLAAGMVDLIVAGQAFHWFERDAARQEFQRILKEKGVVVLIWNERLILSDFEREYEQLIIRHGRNYLKVDHRNIGFEEIKRFFHPGSVSLEILENHQVFDFESLKGRLLSSSYMPNRSEEGYEAMITDLKALFDRYEQQGTIRINYETKVYIGKF